MSMKLCFATNNPNKLREINKMVGNAFTIIGLEDVGCLEELAEDGTTLEANSFQKASYVTEKFGIPCFADDTGLEVASLDGAPGVYSARYAGEQKDSQDNMRLLLDNLRGVKDRSARFRTVITYVHDEKVLQFEGVVDGHIIEEMKGSEGFGYDPIFIPKGHDITFAEMSASEKNKISHRGRAFEKFMAYLKS